MLERIKSIWMDEEGLTTVEYALLLALIAVAAIVAWTTLGQNVGATVTDVNDDLVQAGTGS